MPATGRKTNRGTRKHRRAGRSSKKLRLALFSDSSKLSRSLSSSTGPETIELTRFDPTSFTKAHWVAEPYDAIIVEQGPATGNANANGLIRWLKKTNPSVPLIALDPSNNGREPDARSVYALHLSEVPRKGVLRSLVRDAQRHLETTRKATELSRASGRLLGGFKFSVTSSRPRTRFSSPGAC